MDKKKLWSCILFVIAGLLFVTLAILGKRWILLSVGCCLIAIGVINWMRGR